MSFFPPKIQKRLESSKNGGAVIAENALGKDASFVCGSFVSFSIRIDSTLKKIVAAAFQTNGCGYMAAAADVLAETVKGRPLADLHGLNDGELRLALGDSLGAFSKGRDHCLDCCIGAIRAAFADYRARQIEEFQGEKALICTCFSVTEETIERHIEQKSFKTVDEVTLACNAGGGCGSCRMLIQEMLDRSEFQI